MIFFLGFKGAECRTRLKINVKKTTLLGFRINDDEDMVSSNEKID